MRLIAEEDDDEARAKDANRELTFVESVFAFVFGRGAYSSHWSPYDPDGVVNAIP